MQFASGSSDRSVRLFDLSARVQLQQFTDHADTVNKFFIIKTLIYNSVFQVKAVAYINKLELLASGSYDCTIKLYNPLSYLLKDTIKTESIVNCLNYMGF